MVQVGYNPSCQIASSTNRASFSTAKARLLYSWPETNSSAAPQVMRKIFQHNIRMTYCIYSINVGTRVQTIIEFLHTEYNAF